MCDENCANLKPDRIRCEACRTINLARHKEQKPNMQIYDKCKATAPCMPVQELPVHPTCIKVCSKEEFLRRKSGQTARLVHPPIGHGKLMYAVKAGMVVGTVWFTYSQGVWSDQKTTSEAVKRWQEYMRSFNTRRPPNFDPCGNVIVKETTDSIIAPAYAVYKEFITTCFSGVVKFPAIIKCMYLDYLKQMELKEIADAKERMIRKKSM